MKKEIVFRRAKIKDYDGVVKLLKSKPVDLIGGRWLTRELFKKLLSNKNNLYFVAESNKKVIGSLFSSHDGGYSGHIYKVAVHPGFRGKKVATNLVKIARDSLKTTGINWIYCHIRKDNKSSINLFESLGFKFREGMYLFAYKFKKWI